MKYGRRKRRLGLILSGICLLLCLAGAGTYAFLSDQEGAANIFTVGRVGISLAETTGDSYQMVPGLPITKDPVVTVKAGSETCWVFLRLQEENGLSDFARYAIAPGWKKLEDGIYYRKADKSDTHQHFHILENDTLQVPDSVTQAALEGMAALPRLTVYAQACQYYAADGEPFTPEAAWQTLQEG